MTVQFRANLQRLARHVQPGRQRMQHRAAIRQPRHTVAIEQVRVDARRLRRDVGANTHGAARQLIDQLEGAQIHIMAGTGHQRIDVFEQRRHHQLVAVSAKRVEQRAAQVLDPPRFTRQHVGDVFRQSPARHSSSRSDKQQNCTAGESRSKTNKPDLPVAHFY